MINKKIIIIGLGGIGSALSEFISKFLNYTDLHPRIKLVDGDAYEEKNLDRQMFGDFGNKAFIKKEELGNIYTNITFDIFDKYINEDNIKEVISEDNIVMLAVDNHKTRKVVSDYCKKLKDIILISSGNEYTDGNVQIYIRKNNEDVQPDLCSYHPEIENANDLSPEDMSCSELAKSDPQLFFANLTAAICMCWVYYNIIKSGTCLKSEVYFDMLTMSILSISRSVKKA